MHALDDLIAPVSVEAFRRDYLGRRPLHIPAGADRRRRAVLDWAGFNRLLDQRGLWTAETLRLMNDREAVPPGEYCRYETTMAGTALRPSQEKVQAWIAAGASVVANEVQTLHAPIEAVAALLSRTFAARVGANAYCSFEGVQAFGPHFDNHDVFAIQTEGEKRWRIYQTQLDMPVDLPPDTPETRRWLESVHGPLESEVVTRPGDLLYLPRGRFHEAIAVGEASLHVTFSVTPLYGRILFSLLESAALQFPAFRRYFPPAWDDGARPLAAHLAELARLLGDLAASPAFVDEVAMAQERLALRVVSSALPARLDLTRYRVTGRPFPAARAGVQAAWDWCRERGAFSLEDLVAEVDFVEPGRLQEAVREAEGVGALERIGPGD